METLHTPQSRGIEVRVSADGRTTELRALRAFEVGEPITAFFGEIVAYDRADRDDERCCSHVPGRWMLNCRVNPDTGRVIRQRAVLRNTYRNGVAAFARCVPYQSGKVNACIGRIDDVNNSIAMEKGQLEKIDPHERTSLLFAAERIYPGQEITYCNDVIIDEDDDDDDADDEASDEHRWRQRGVIRYRFRHLSYSKVIEFTIDQK